MRYSETEYAQVSAAAARATLSATSYVAEAALAAAKGTAAPDASPLRELVVELMAARAQVRRVGVNVNQAVAKLNATGAAPVWLADALRLCERAVARVDEAAAAISRQLR